MSVSRQQRAAIEDRRANVRRLLSSKATDHEIAAILSDQMRIEVSHDTVRRDRLFILAEWRERGHEALEDTIARERAELEAIEREAAINFASSKDPRFLQVRLAAKERLSRLLGLDAPTRREVIAQVTTTDADAIDPSKLTDEDLEALLIADRVRLKLAKGQG